MPSPRPITIVGGGLAGLTLGIGLRQRSVPVTVWEAGRYPRHRVCGEFICGRGPTILDRLQLRSLMERAGAIQSTSTRFIAGRNRSPVRQLPSPALCLSRYEMDAALAREFQRLGGELRSPARWSNPITEGVVLATGRRAQPTEGGWRWFGLKVHARDVELTADLEMHVSGRGYVGVNRIDGGCVNVCGLFRAQAWRTFAREAPGVSSWRARGRRCLSGSSARVSTRIPFVRWPAFRCGLIAGVKHRNCASVMR